MATDSEIGRCTYRKHHIPNDRQICDCGCVIMGKTVAGNATIVTVLHRSLEQTFPFLKDDGRLPQDAS